MLAVVVELVGIQAAGIETSVEVAEQTAREAVVKGHASWEIGLPFVAIAPAAPNFSLKLLETFQRVG